MHDAGVGCNHEAEQHALNRLPICGRIFRIYCEGFLEAEGQPIALSTSSHGSGPGGGAPRAGGRNEQLRDLRAYRPRRFFGP